MEAFLTQDMKIVVADLSANHHATIDQYQAKKFFQGLVHINFSLILVGSLKNIESKIRSRVKSNIAKKIRNLKMFKYLK